MRILQSEGGAWPESWLPFTAFSAKAFFPRSVAVSCVVWSRARVKILSEVTSMSFSLVLLSEVLLRVAGWVFSFLFFFLLLDLPEAILGKMAGGRLLCILTGLWSQSSSLGSCEWGLYIT